MLWHQKQLRLLRSGRAEVKQWCRRDPEVPLSDKETLPTKDKIVYINISAITLQYFIILNLEVFFMGGGRVFHIFVAGLVTHQFVW